MHKEYNIFSEKVSIASGHSGSVAKAIETVFAFLERNDTSETAPLIDVEEVFLRDFMGFVYKFSDHFRVKKYDTGAFFFQINIIVPDAMWELTFHRIQKWYEYHEDTDYISGIRCKTVDFLPNDADNVLLVCFIQESDIENNDLEKLLWSYEKDLQWNLTFRLG